MSIRVVDNEDDSLLQQHVVLLSVVCIIGPWQLAMATLSEQVRE